MGTEKKAGDSEEIQVVEGISESGALRDSAGNVR